MVNALKTEGAQGEQAQIEGHREKCGDIETDFGAQVERECIDGKTDLWLFGFPNATTPGTFLGMIIY